MKLTDGRALPARRVGADSDQHGAVFVDQMPEFGDIRRGALGFTYDDFTSARPLYLAGAVVRAVDPRSAAERAGLKPVVTELGGTPIRDAADPQIRLALLRTGEIAEFVVSRPSDTLTVARRNGGTLQVAVNMGAAPYGAAAA
jgi:S1-C subfamily serine protease